MTRVGKLSTQQEAPAARQRTLSRDAFLALEELRSMTGFVHADKQEAWLRDRAIPYRRDGKRLLVLWSHVTRWVEGSAMPAEFEDGAPNWNALN